MAVFVVGVPLLATRRKYWELYDVGAKATHGFLMRLVKILPTSRLIKVFPEAAPRFLGDYRAAANILYLVVLLIAAGLALKLGIGMMAEADNTITAPDANNTEAYDAYTKTTNTIWKSFQMAPMALYATVFGVVIGAVVAAFGIFGGRGGGGL